MSYEKDILQSIQDGESLPQKVDLNILKYFWQASPVFGAKKQNIPKFLRAIDVFKNFTDNELRILCRHFHLRKFDSKEIIFKQLDLGVGFYLIYSGTVDIIVEDSNRIDEEDEKTPRLVVSLDSGDYFGELALLQENSLRNASAISRDNTLLLGIFKPDVEELINIHPIIATKLLQSISIIIANRLYSLTKEARSMKQKLFELEKELEDKQ
ncbi:MAG: cyclic nucleotide-binding domain-containing protein [Halobacteriovoraceae bacterium]|nr:cyclic nucleotide-binding domain-containing protein [Halobacteriovoraceae bacterium]